MRRILFLSAIAVVSLLSFCGCDEDNILNGEENNPANSEISVVLNNDSLSLFVGEKDTLIATISYRNVIVDNEVNWLSDNASVAVVDSNGVVTAISVGSAVISVSYQGVSVASCKVTVSERPVPFENGFEYVDLGLSAKWATYNVGATKPEEYGEYYAWGETESKSDYSWLTYKYRISGDTYDNVKFNKYVSYSSSGIVDNKVLLDNVDDVAYVKWGGSWHIPTVVEMVELYDNCTWTWTTQNGINGYLITSKVIGYTDCSIFLPAAGFRNDTLLNDAGGKGKYWSRNLDKSMDTWPWNYTFCSDYTVLGAGSDDRSIGCSVRPVCPSEEWLSHISMYLNRDSLMLVPDGCGYIRGRIKYDNNDYSYPNDGFVWISDNPAVAVVDDEGNVTAISKGTAHIIASLGSLSEQCTVTVTDESEISHEFVDLGLSVKWATFNVGASKPEDFGGYYAWGETSVKSEYTWENYKFRSSGDSQSNIILSKYNNKSEYGVLDSINTLDIEDDVAHVKWGGNWRMPTYEEQKELCDNCTWVWYDQGNTEFGGVAGYKIVSKKTGYTDRFIFLPSCGFHERKSYDISGGYFCYWSSSLSSTSPFYARYLGFDGEGISPYFAGDRFRGLPVRPVCP